MLLSRNFLKAELILRGWGWGWGRGTAERRRKDERGAELKSDSAPERCFKAYRASYSLESTRSVANLDVVLQHWARGSVNEKGRGRQAKSRCQFRKMHGFSPAWRGIDADYVNTAEDQVLGQLTGWLWSSSLGESPASAHF
jgi:hypothetical protein